jgi:RNA 2',3'-cyclic 3'-phosphodiesterase
VTEGRALRLFVALELPVDVVGALSEFGASVDGEVWRLVSPESLHVTLAFLGATDASLVPAAAGAISSSASGVRAPELRLGSPLLLPPRRPRVLTVALEDGSGALGALQASVADALVEAGVFAPEARPFRPHVTVARLRPRARAPRRVRGALPPLAFRGVAVTLFSSHTTAAGPRYEPLARVDLVGGRTTD